MRELLIIKFASPDNANFLTFPREQSNKAQSGRLRNHSIRQLNRSAD